MVSFLQAVPARHRFIKLQKSPKAADPLKGSFSTISSLLLFSSGQSPLDLGNNLSTLFKGNKMREIPFATKFHVL